MCEGCTASCGQVKKKISFEWNKLFYMIMGFFLIAAWFYARTNTVTDFEVLLQNQMKKVSIVETVQNESYRIIEKNGTESLVLLSEESGYGGPFTMATWIGADSLIRDVFVLENRETPSFYKKLQDRSFFYQFKKKALTDSFVGGEDVDFISGATVSSLAFTKAIRNASYQGARENFGMSIKKVDEPFNVGWKELIILLLILLSIVASIKSDKRLRLAIQMSSLVFLGFVYNAALSISGFSSLALGFFPSIKEHLGWWMLIIGSFGSIIFLTRNIYCSYLCPFHGIQILLNKISGINLKLSPILMKRSKQMSLFLLCLSLLLIFISGNPTQVSYEPFAMIFSLEGIGWQWYILPATLLGSFFIKDFFCKFFCPVGQSFTLMIKGKQKLIKHFKPTKLKSYEQKTCNSYNCVSKNQ